MHARPAAGMFTMNKRIECSFHRRTKDRVYSLHKHRCLRDNWRAVTEFLWKSILTENRGRRRCRCRQVAAMSCDVSDRRSPTSGTERAKLRTSAPVKLTGRPRPLTRWDPCPVCHRDDSMSLIYEQLQFAV